MRRPRPRSTLILTLFPYTTLFRSPPTQGQHLSLSSMARRMLSGDMSPALVEIGRAHVELQSHSEISYAVFCLKKKKKPNEKRWTVYAVDMLTARLIGSEKYHKYLSTRINNDQKRSQGSTRFFFNDTATTEIYTNLNTLSLHDALPI